jgi:DNA polymerase-1
VAEQVRIVLGRDGSRVAALTMGADGVNAQESVDLEELPAWVAERERRGGIRWIWNDTVDWYPGLLEAGVRVARCQDLRLTHAILRHAAGVAGTGIMRGSGEWDAPPAGRHGAGTALFSLSDWPARTGVPADVSAAHAEFARQQDAVATSRDPGRLRLLVAAESAGALVAAEMTAAGLPWDRHAHDDILTGVLGERSATGVPAHLADAAGRVRAALGDPNVRLDSPVQLLRSLRRAGLSVESTGRWELAQHDHPAIPPLLEYKRLARLMSANGWAWLDEWVRDGRFRPVFIPGGVVTGRWASAGGGALQLPRQLRPAVRADAGWMLVVADVAQLEPRVLAGMSGDRGLAEAARGRDLYEGIVATTAITERADAKMALLGAMYGATSGTSGRLAPQLRRSFPRAMAMVDAAAARGEDGGEVSTLLGRTSPAPDPRWLEEQRRASEDGATPAEISRSRSRARDRGRFTRNFIVQGTAAEWALAWLADLRAELAQAPAAMTEATLSGPVFGRRPHLAFFLHDEVIVHTPAEQADAVAAQVRRSAERAGRLLFGDFPIDFPLDVRVSRTAEAK